MAAPTTATKDKNYDLISALHASLHNVWQVETWAKDAEREGDTELAEWFRKIQHNNQKAADQGKELLMRRLREDS
ncbi:hypothetical protein [Haloechinothrix halophila]|uniref:hypothetical protein n=1 Tax=Haloechinothrix halophila TaxID=1069073 RepID=UPI000412FD41|nr:hypothetical protein [Haloechinothrix halophila]